MTFDNLSQITSCSISFIDSKGLSGGFKAWNCDKFFSLENLHGLRIIGNIFVPSNSTFFKIGGSSLSMIKSEARKSALIINIAIAALDKFHPGGRKVKMPERVSTSQFHGNPTPEYGKFHKHIERE